MEELVHFIAFDLGAESGRAVLGTLEEDTLFLEEIHRFPNGPIRILDNMYWDVLRQFAEMKEGLRKCKSHLRGRLESIAIDTWGVDFGLFAKDDTLLGNPFHYRDKRTDGMMDHAFSIVPREEVFNSTGIQFMQLNTLYQVFSMVKSDSIYLKNAKKLLFMAGLFNYWFSGKMVAEFTLATTSQMFDPRKNEWAKEMLTQLDIPIEIMPEIVPPGTDLGPILPSILQEAGLEDVSVIAPACHDTGSAVAAVPAQGNGWAYLSSGTWSLMGVEVKEPVINEKSLAYNFTNEGGVEDTYRLLKNIAGLWLVQECKRTWERQGHFYSYDQLTQMASDAEPFKSLLNPDDSRFLNPVDMPKAIQNYCRETSQPVPETPGAIVRCALESLALKYRSIMGMLQDLSDEPIERLHIVGGGTQNKLLNQFAANSLGMQVVTGPIEATAIGNLLMQAISKGHISNVAEGREIVRNSFPTETYEPTDTEEWKKAYERFQRLT